MNQQGCTTACAVLLMCVGTQVVQVECASLSKHYQQLDDGAFQGLEYEPTDTDTTFNKYVNDTKSEIKKTGRKDFSKIGSEYTNDTTFHKFEKEASDVQDNFHLNNDELQQVQDVRKRSNTTMMQSVVDGVSKTARVHKDKGMIHDHYADADLVSTVDVHTKETANNFTHLASGFHKNHHSTTTNSDKDSIKKSKNAMEKENIRTHLAKTDKSELDSTKGTKKKNELNDYTYKMEKNMVDEDGQEDESVAHSRTTDNKYFDAAGILTIIQDYLEQFQRVHHKENGQSSLNEETEKSSIATIFIKQIVEIGEEKPSDEESAEASEEDESSSKDSTQSSDEEETSNEESTHASDAEESSETSSRDTSGEKSTEELTISADTDNSGENVKSRKRKNNASGKLTARKIRNRDDSEDKSKYKLTSDLLINHHQEPENYHLVPKTFRPAKKGRHYFSKFQEADQDLQLIDKKGSLVKAC